MQLADIQKKERLALEFFYGKVNKIPAFVEIIKKYTIHSDICIEMIRLHRATIVTRIESIYDLLELNDRIQKEFAFLMKISAQIKNLQRDGNFLYIRDFAVFYETNIKKVIEETNLDITKYNRLVLMKNFSILGILIPVQKKLEIFL